MRRIPFLGVVFLASCGGRSANCEFEIKGATICMDGMSMSYCRQEYGGQPTEADSSDDPMCSDLGYPVVCEGYSFVEVGGNFTATHNNFHAVDEADCETVDGARLDHSD